MSSLHFDILTKEQTKIFNGLRVFRRQAVLFGGTALALQICHRLSFDFDLFFRKDLGRKEILRLKKSILLKEVGLETKEQVNIITANNILVNLVSYPFEPLFKTEKTFSIPLFSTKDIALDKAYTIGRRATWRDYVDLFFLLRGKYVTLPEIVKLSHKKFGPLFNGRLFLEQLSYFKDIEPTKISFVKESFSNRKIEAFLINEVKEFKTQF